MRSILRPIDARLLVLLPLFFVSGCAALIYQVLWVRELGLLFGSTAQAAALTIGIFFTGIALGGWFWGRRAAALRDSLRGFGWLELAVGATALGHFFLLDLYQALYPALYQWLGHLPLFDTLLKALLAAGVLLLPSFLMGGTLPMLGEYLVRDQAELGQRGSLLYAINTAGAATGALAAGFVLPIWLGFHGSYLIAVGLDLVVGTAALLLAWFWGPPEVAAQRPAPARCRAVDRPSAGSLVWVVAFASGFAALAIEVIWTRLFAQVLQNSVYTYAVVLVTFLLALSLGAALANRLCRLSGARVSQVLGALLGLSAVLVAVSPWLFSWMTGELSYVGAGAGWGNYLRSVAGVAAVVMLIPAVIFGAVLPYLLRLLQQSQQGPGRLIGSLIAVNTVGSILGALAAGFIILPFVGANVGLLMLAACYLLLMFAVQVNEGGGWRVQRGALAAGVLAAALVMALALPVGQLQRVSLQAAHQERLLDFVEGSHASVAVIERDGHRLLRANNHYTLGGTGALASERNQTLIPMMTHPAPRDVFYLGMGTGITAGAALLFPVDRVVVCELLPEVVQLAPRWFGPWSEGLFSDPRVEIHAEDGRNCLRRSQDTYDLIISDLFTPWKAGTGNLYTLEHYRRAAQRLNPGGLYVQWIPTYQVSRSEFGIIARTMTEAFDQVVLWRGDLFPNHSVVALVGQPEASPLDPMVPVAHGRSLAGNPALPEDLLAAVSLRFYAGNITASQLFASYPVNTENRALIELQAPRTQRAMQAGLVRALTGDQLGLLYEQLQQAPGLDQDPYLGRLTDAQRGYVVAGRSYFHYGVYRLAGLDQQAAPFLEDFLQRTPFQQAPADPPQPETLSGWEE